MPRYTGTIKLARSPLMTLIGEILAGVEPAGDPMPTGVVHVRSGLLAPLPGRAFGANVSGPVTNGVFSIDAPEPGAAFRYRLLIERSNGATAVPIYRSLDLPAAGADNLAIFVRVVDEADAQALANLDATSNDPDPTVVTSDEIDAAAQAADASDPRVSDASGRIEDGFVKLDFKYQPFPDLPRFKVKGTLTLEPEPSRAYATEQLVDLEFVRLDLRRFAATVEDTRWLRARAQAATHDINARLAEQFRQKLVALGERLNGTVTIVSATEPGDELRLLTAFGFLVPLAP